MIGFITFCQGNCRKECHGNLMRVMGGFPSFARCCGVQLSCQSILGPAKLFVVIDTGTSSEFAMRREC